VIRVAALACAVTGCSTLVFHPAAPRSPADVVPVELQRSPKTWTVVLAASRDLQLRRIAWVDSNVAPCQGGLAPATIDGAPAAQFQGIRAAAGQRLEIGFPAGPPEWPTAATPTAIDVEEVRPEGTICQRVPLTGLPPDQQWHVPQDWAVLVGGEFGLSVDRVSTTARPIDPVLVSSLVVGAGRWIGRLRLEANVEYGGVICRGCGVAMTRAAAGAGVTGVIWQGRAQAVEVGLGYRRSYEFNDDVTLAFNGARLAIAWGHTPPPIAGLDWNSARALFTGVEAFTEWQTTGDSRVAPQLLVGLGVVVHLPIL